MKLEVLYKMNLHEMLPLDDNPYIQVLKVMDGWIYEFYDPDTATTSTTYVPER